MSSRTYIDYGYGITTGEVDKAATADGIRELLKKAPNAKQKIEKCLAESGIAYEKATVEEFIFTYPIGKEYSETSVGELLCVALNEIAGGDIFDTVSDEDGENYVMIYPAYPWSTVSEAYKNLDTTEKVDALFKEAIVTITDGKEVDAPDYQECENFG